MWPSVLTSDAVGQCPGSRQESNKSVANAVNVFLQVKVVRTVTFAF